MAKEKFNLSDFGISKAEMKRMMAREHNRQFDQAKANPTPQSEIIKEAVLDAVGVARKSLDI